MTDLDRLLNEIEHLNGATFSDVREKILAADPEVKAILRQEILHLVGKRVFRKILCRDLEEVHVADTPLSTDRAGKGHSPGGKNDA